MSNRRNKKAFGITITAVMAALAGIMSFFEINIIPGVSYMKIDFSDFPAILTGIAFGPGCGVLVEIVKNLIHLPRSTTMGIGEIMNTVVGCGIVLSMSFFTKLFARSFKEKRFSAKTYILTSAVTIILTIIVGWLANMAFTPAYFKIMGIPLEKEVYWAGVWGSTALNTVKAAFNVFPFYPVYRAVEKFVKKYTV